MLVRFRIFTENETIFVLHNLLQQMGCFSAKLNLQQKKENFCFSDDVFRNKIKNLKLRILNSLFLKLIIFENNKRSQSNNY
jgi:hypothetical protein